MKHTKWIKHRARNRRYKTKRYWQRHKITQTLIFPKSKFTKQQVLEWAKQHGFKHYTVRTEGDKIRVRQFPPSQVDKVLGLYPIGKDVKGLYVTKKNYGSIISKEQEIKDLESKKSKLIIKAFKQFPSSPLQLKTRKEIDEITNKVNELKNETSNI